jgi:hypothetical protein
MNNNYSNYNNYIFNSSDLKDFETPEDELISNSEYKELLRLEREVQKELKELDDSKSTLTI